jgi:glycerol-3-phosphate dehydrogenase
MDRNKSLAEIRNGQTTWDVAIIGGGSSGLGVALDALSRGLKVVLLERADFAKGTSSRSTKLLPDSGPFQLPRVTVPKPKKYRAAIRWA